MRPVCLVQVRDYLLALESHLSEAHRQASRLTAKEVELGEATLEFGQASGAVHAVVTCCFRQPAHVAACRHMMYAQYAAS